MIAYLDTNAVLTFAPGWKAKISRGARKLIDSSDLLLSPMVLLELEYLYEIRKLGVPSVDLHLKLEHELGV